MTIQGPFLRFLCFIPPLPTIDCSANTDTWQTRLRRDVVYIFADQQRPPYTSPNAGEGESCGASANEYSCAHYVTWSLNKLWRSTSIFNLCFRPINISIGIQTRGEGVVGSQATIANRKLVAFAKQHSGIRPWVFLYRIISRYLECSWMETEIGPEEKKT